MIVKVLSSVVDVSQKSNSTNNVLNEY